MSPTSLPQPDRGRPSPQEADGIRVVCVTYHPGAELTTFADTLAAATSRPVELVLVDNGGDTTVPDAVARTHGAQVVPAGGNLGYGRAANLGARGATQPWLVVANPDIVWHPGSLDELIAAADRHPGAGALGPALLNVDGTRYPSARELPSLRQGAGHALLGRRWPRNPWTRAYQRRQEDVTSVERRAGWLSGACLLVRRAAFEQVGGFDESYFMFFEDLDLGERLGLAGWLNVHVPSAEVTHLGGTTWRERPAAMIRAHHASARQYLCRRYDRWYHWPVRVGIRVGLTVRQVAELRSAARQGLT